MRRVHPMRCAGTIRGVHACAAICGLGVEGPSDDVAQGRWPFGNGRRDRQSDRGDQPALHRNHLLGDHGGDLGCDVLVLMAPAVRRIGIGTRQRRDGALSVSPAAIATEKLSPKIACLSWRSRDASHDPCFAAKCPRQPRNCLFTTICAGNRNRGVPSSPTVGEQPPAGPVRPIGPDTRRRRQRFARWVVATASRASFAAPRQSPHPGTDGP